ncbi:hypothetical protein QYE76_041477 [Lolium multiflorum]|uniref:RRM domain-containing protein n=1 Tax=Lolium multiflorum TaxID=4521 RepID=A0AAD8WU70_LOLMU|nr:hypothetical protein QYE76_041477 [Lolium multiflorum]
MQEEPSSLSQWSDLPPDVLREISGLLREAGDVVSFHAVCKPWRDSHEQTRKRKQLGLPWLLAPNKMIDPFYINMRCIFSRRSYFALPPFSMQSRNWVASADGTAVWYLSESPSPSLRDPLTEAVTLLLPPFPHEKGRWKRSPNGIVYSDGTVLLYHMSRYVHGDPRKLRAALLRPGDATWMVVDRTFRSADYMYVSYYHGKILITVDGPVLTPDDEAGIGDVLALSRPWLPGELDDYIQIIYMHSYTLESRGELLCVSIYIDRDYPYAYGGKPNVGGLVRSLWMVVHALVEDESAPGKMRWVEKDGNSLADRVLFLGRPNSFSVDASRLKGGSDDAVTGGCAYFIYHELGVMPDRPCCVFRYSFKHGSARFVERLPQGWDNYLYMWLFPHPSIAPTQEIIDRLEGRKWWKKKKKKEPHMAPTPTSNIYKDDIPQPQCYNTYLRVYVENLPPKVDSFQLRKFLSKYGKVSNVQVVCKRKNKKSTKIGLVNIAMMEKRADALATLNGLVFNGHTLYVRLLRMWKGRRMPPAGSNQHSHGNLICIVLLLFFFILTVWWKLI